VNRRTTLQPIDAAPSRPAPTPVERPTPPSVNQPSRITLVAGTLVVAGIVLLTGLVLSASRSTPSSPAEAAPTSVPTAAPAPIVAAAPLEPTPACPSIAAYLDVITSYERQARWTLAATTAQTAMRTPALCAADRAILGQKLISLSREALFEQPPAPEDAPGQRRVASAYADLKILARQYEVQVPAPLPIAQSAYDNRLFLLATDAYSDALTSGDASRQDRDVVRADYASQYNLGSIWAQRSDPHQRQEGLARLATACRIDERNQLNSGDACATLQRLVGPRTMWPTPLADPLS
jgi:hypothetical protein